jgi:hypothetical protein
MPGKWICGSRLQAMTWGAVDDPALAADGREFQLPQTPQPATRKFSAALFD